MEANSSNKINLTSVRAEIDAIDLSIVEALQKRFGVVERVLLAKKLEEPDDLLPIRPAREATILRNLAESSGGRLPARMIYRIWRSIICEATIIQAPVQINITGAVASIPEADSILRNHFPGFTFKNYSKVKTALNSLATSSLEICAVLIDDKWIRHLLRQPKFSTTRIINVLPFAGADGEGMIALLGRCPSEPTGEDETVVATKGHLPRDFIPAPLWERETADGYCLTSLPGFFTRSESPLVGLIRGNKKLELTVLGRYPSPFEV